MSIWHALDNASAANDSAFSAARRAFRWGWGVLGGTIIVCTMVAGPRGFIVGLVVGVPLALYVDTATAVLVALAVIIVLLLRIADSHQAR